MMDKSDKIFVAGYRGLVGSALIRRLEREGFHNLPRRDRAQLDFVNESAVAEFFRKEKPAVVIFAAAKVGGIKANNDFPVEFLLDNLRTTSFAPPTKLARASFCFLAALAFTPSSHRSPFQKQLC